MTEPQARRPFGVTSAGRRQCVCQGGRGWTRVHGPGTPRERFCDKPLHHIYQNTAAGRVLGPGARSASLECTGPSASHPTPRHGRVLMWVTGPAAHGKGSRDCCGSPGSRGASPPAGTPGTPRRLWRALPRHCGAPPAGDHRRELGSAVMCQPLHPSNLCHRLSSAKGVSGSVVRGPGEARATPLWRP